MTRVSYSVYISGTNTFLIIGKPCTGRMGFTHKIGNKRVHPRSGEQDSGVIIRKQGLSGYPYMAFALKE